MTNIERRMRRSSRKFVTLIEMMIVMLLLAIVAGVGGYGLSRLIQAQKFESELEGIELRLNRARELLMLLNIETKMSLLDKKLELVPVGTVSDSYLKLLEKEKLQLDAIDKIEFHPLSEGAGEPVFYFLDRGLRLPFGILTLTSFQGEERYLLFKGYAEPWHFVKTEPDWPVMEQQEREMKESLTRSTWVPPNG